MKWKFNPLRVVLNPLIILSSTLQTGKIKFIPFRNVGHAMICSFWDLFGFLGFVWVFWDLFGFLNCLMQGFGKRTKIFANNHYLHWRKTFGIQSFSLAKDKQPLDIIYPRVKTLVYQYVRALPFFERSLLIRNIMNEVWVATRLAKDEGGGHWTRPARKEWSVRT
ncbi:MULTISPECIES: hypothetical protein [Rhodonellum]|uniref:LAGLIDADG homing endonuclease n=1 Tax=Rhodonellum ikkaensis TaxID=336829 RepID=A0A1H3U9J9_9BACT|nr:MULTISPECIES: hypothetical protein [Rhodonellum]SDZ58485.1 hypothetical protein SAMN05444412_13413 [Rhodonellum ikkaensis]